MYTLMFCSLLIMIMLTVYELLTIIIFVINNLFEFSVKRNISEKI